MFPVLFCCNSMAALALRSKMAKHNSLHAGKKLTWKNWLVQGIMTQDYEMRVMGVISILLARCCSNAQVHSLIPSRHG